VHFDSQLAGFGVRVYRSGRKAYVLQYGGREKRRLMVLAPCTAGKDVDKARDKAQTFLRQHQSEGTDPLNEKRKAAAGTVAAVVTEYIEARKPQWSEGEAKRAKGRMTRHITPHVGDVTLEKLTRREVRQMHSKISQKTKYEANRSLELLRAAINWALSDLGWRAANLAEGENPALRIQTNHEKSRREWIRPDEVPGLIAAISTEESPWTQAFFRMVLFTGARKSELLNLQWSDVDLKGRTIKFRDTKNREDHDVPLSPEAVKLLRDLPRTIGNPFVFCGHVKGEPLVNVYKPWKRILKQAGIDRRVTIHDLRRTTGSLLASAGFSTQQIGKLLNHKSAITAKVYAEIADQAKVEMTGALARMLR
jgi:integrase